MSNKKPVSFVISSVLAGSLLLGAVEASAYEAGDFVFRTGAATVAPNDDSSNLSLNGTELAGTAAEVESNTQLGLNLTYMLTRNLGLGLLAATPFEHDLKADLGGVTVDAGSAKHLPPTLTLQYFPLDPSSAIQPYIGVGVNYTAFFSEDVDSELENALGDTADLELDASWGLAAQAGVDFQLSDNWLLNASVWYLDIDTEAEFKFDNLDLNVSADVDIDPWVYMVGIGYQF